ncbi:MAG: hypothetical protein K0B11_02780 [Mariniphaga sp.]|nr:hypothetical protein [Mariniphaga sp.]
MISKKWGKLLILAVFLVIGLAAIQIFIAKPESDEFSREKIRLAEVENELTQAIENGDTIKAKTLIIQLRWQYEPSTIGGQSEADALKNIWNAKRKEYLILMGEDTDKYNFETEKKGLKSQWDELINN